MSYEPTEQDAQAINTGRLLRAESDVLLPMLKEKEAGLLQRIIRHYRAGENAQILAAAAELNVIDELRATITAKIKKAEAIERKMYERGI